MNQGRHAGEDDAAEPRWPDAVAATALALVALMLSRDAVLGPGVLGHSGGETLGRLFMLGQVDRWLDGIDPLGRTSLLGAPGTLPAWPIDPVTTALAWSLRALGGGTVGAEALGLAITATALLALSGLATYALARTVGGSVLSAAAAGAVVMLQPHALAEIDGGALEALGAGPLALAILALGLHLERPPAWTALRVAACLGSGLLLAGTAPFVTAFSLLTAVVVVLFAGKERLRLLPGWLPGAGATLAGIALVLAPLVAVEVSAGGRFDAAESGTAAPGGAAIGVVVDGAWVAEAREGHATLPEAAPVDASTETPGAPRTAPAWTKVFDGLPWSLAAAACAVVALLGRRGRALGSAALAMVLAGPGWADAASTIAHGGPAAPSPLEIFVVLVPGGDALGDVHRVLPAATVLAALGAAIVLGGGGAEGQRNRGRKEEQPRGPRRDPAAPGNDRPGKRLRFKTGTDGARRGRGPEGPAQPEESGAKAGPERPADAATEEPGRGWRRRQRERGEGPAQGEGGQGRGARGGGRGRRRQGGGEQADAPGGHGQGGHGQGRWAARRAEREQRGRVSVEVTSPAEPGPAGDPRPPDLDAELEDGPPAPDGPAEPTPKLPSAPSAPGAAGAAGRIYRASDSERQMTPRERRQARWEDERKTREARQEARRTERQAAQAIRQAERQQRRAEEDARRAAAGEPSLEQEAQAEREERQAERARRGQRRAGGQAARDKAEGLRRGRREGQRGGQAQEQAKPPAQVAQKILRVLRQIMPELLCVLALLEAGLTLPRLALDTSPLQVDRDVVAAVSGPVVTFPSGDAPMAVATAPARGTAYLATRHGQPTPADLGRGRAGADLPAQVGIAAAASIPFSSAAWNAVGGSVPGEDQVGRALAAAGARDFLLVKAWLGPVEGARARAWAIARWGAPVVESTWGATWRIVDAPGVLPAGESVDATVIRE